ncbi:MAG TPA: TIGR03557 family F420-dependent LLM class oxidoreductase, partial [Pseudonocardia sp.]|nr:TIGR03557 family F420-dependent LLM class oxidoreductase [Pseudonocardia sp.]
GLGSGERLNEHVVGQGWPPVHVRHEMLREAVEIIRLLWSGGYHSYRGAHLTLEDARVFDLPDTPPLMAIAAGGSRSAELAARHGDALFATEPRAELVEAYREHGGRGPRYAEVPLAWAKDEDTAAASAREMFRFGPMGWKVQAELPNPVNFEAATAYVRDNDMRAAFGCGPDPERHLDVAGQFSDAGFDRLALINAGPDVDAFLDFAGEHLIEPLRSRG